MTSISPKRALPLSTVLVQRSSPSDVWSSSHLFLHAIPPSTTSCQLLLVTFSFFWSHGSSSSFFHKKNKNKTHKRRTISTNSVTAASLLVCTPYCLPITSSLTTLRCREPAQSLPIVDRRRRFIHLNIRPFIQRRKKNDDESKQKEETTRGIFSSAWRGVAGRGPGLRSWRGGGRWSRLRGRRSTRVRRCPR